MVVIATQESLYHSTSVRLFARKCCFTDQQSQNVILCMQLMRYTMNLYISSTTLLSTLGLNDAYDDVLQRIKAAPVNELIVKGLILYLFFETDT